MECFRTQLAEFSEVLWDWAFDEESYAFFAAADEFAADVFFFWMLYDA